jgi:hypothetical protein
MNRRFATVALLVAAVAASTSTVHAEVAFVNNYLDAPGTGFFDPTYGAARRAAWEYAESIWASRLVDLYTPGTETITVRATFQDLGGTALSAPVGNAQPFISHSNFAALSPKFVPNTVYAGALANHLAGTDISPGVAEITAIFNTRIDTGTIVGGRVFYYGLDASPNLTPPSQIDFVTVALHELAHGLGFATSLNSAGQFTNGYTLPAVYDRFVYSGDNDVYLTTYPDNAAGNAARAADIMSSNLFFRSPETIALNGLDGAELYAPGAFTPGSSIVHFDPATFHLMNPGYTIASHNPTLDDLAILSSIGWDINPIPEPASLALLCAALPLLLKRRQR